MNLITLNICYFNNMLKIITNSTFTLTCVYVHFTYHTLILQYDRLKITSNCCFDE